MSTEKMECRHASGYVTAHYDEAFFGLESCGKTVAVDELLFSEFIDFDCDGPALASRFRDFAMYFRGTVIRVAVVGNEVDSRRRFDLRHEDASSQIEKLEAWLCTLTGKAVVAMQTAYQAERVISISDSIIGGAGHE